MSSGNLTVLQKLNSAFEDNLDEKVYNDAEEVIRIFNS